MVREALITQILARGTENIVPDEQTVRSWLQSGRPLNIYLGIDPTATHIHLGHAVPLRKLQWLAELGHHVHFLIGDFTALVGDTSDKNSERPVLTAAEIQQNFLTYQQQASKILDFSLVKVVHNSEWLGTLNFADILSLMRHFSVNDFISRELIRNRLQSGLRVGLAEVLYPIMQGYDSYMLDTDIQLGGTDQIFNMQAGRTLQHKLRGRDSGIIANGFLPGTDGRKMSKSWGNAIWLDDDAPTIFGKVMSLRDDLLPEYFRLATNLADDELAQIMAELPQAHPMEMKKRLARQIISELIGPAAVPAAERHFVQSVQEKVAPDDVAILTVSPALTVPDLLTLLADHGWVDSRSAARRLWEQGGLYLNEQRVGEQLSLTASENILRVGKRRYVRLMVS